MSKLWFDRSVNFQDQILERYSSVLGETNTIDGGSYLRLSKFSYAEIRRNFCQELQPDKTNLIETLFKLIGRVSDLVISIPAPSWLWLNIHQMIGGTYQQRKMINAYYIYRGRRSSE